MKGRDDSAAGPVSELVIWGILMRGKPVPTIGQSQMGQQDRTALLPPDHDEDRFVSREDHA